MPDAGNYFVFRGKSLDGRKWVDQNGKWHAPPVLWRGNLGMGGSVHLLVHVGRHAPDAPSALSPLLTKLVATIDDIEPLNDDEKADLREVGVLARTFPQFAPPGTNSVGTFLVSVRKGTPWGQPTMRVYAVENAGLPRIGSVGGAMVECTGGRSRYEVGLTLGKP